MVVPEINIYSTITYRNHSSSTPSTIGTTDNYLAMKGYKIDRGSFFTESDITNLSNVVVLGSKVVDEYFGRADPVGETIKIGENNFVVMGTLKTSGSSWSDYEDNSVYIPITTAQHKLCGINTIGTILLKAAGEENVEKATVKAKEILRIEHGILPGEPNDFSIQSNTSMLKMAGSITKTISLALGGIAAISLLVGGIGIMNIMFVSVSERTREIIKPETINKIPAFNKISNRIIRSPVVCL
jgi:putative ABC transport system permease protein